MIRRRDRQAAGNAACRSRPRGVLTALCLTQITSWGIVYYAFPVLAPRIAADTEWSMAATSAAFSTGLLVSAAAGIPIGAILDRHGPRTVMTGGSILAVVAVLSVAHAPNLPLFTAAWMAAGIAMASTFYQPAFAALTRWYGPERVRALTTLTLAGGLASTVFAPTTATLADHLGWRTTYTTLAVVLAVVTIPAHALALRPPWPPGPSTPQRERNHQARATARGRPFLLLTAALALSGFAMFAVVNGLIPLLTTRGAAPTTAAWALGMGGLGQTAGRALYATLARRTGVRGRTAGLIGAGGATTTALAMIPGPVPLLIALVIVAGMIRGNLTLLQATAVTDRWGTASYGRLSGLLAAPVTIATALAPFAGAALAGPLGGYPHLFGLLVALSALSALLALGT